MEYGLVIFSDKVKTTPSASGTGYPYRISAADLDKNFAITNLIVDNDWIDSSGGQRYLKLPRIPDSDEIQTLSVVDGSITWYQILPQRPKQGTYVLSCIDGALHWMETQDC